MQYKPSIVESFKKNRLFYTVKKILPKIQNLKRGVNSIIKKPFLWASFVDWKKLRSDVSFWIFEAVVEGIVANWWTHKIFGLEFSVGMIIAHGFLIKQGMNLYWRLRRDGQSTKLPAKN